MKHEPQLETWLGFSLSREQWATLEAFETWLADEGIAAGLVSAGDRERIWERHILDGLSFATGWRRHPPDQLLDAGSGGGLPGIPLAVAFPGTAVTLLDRSKKRIALLKRALRVLRLDNAEAREGDVRFERGWEAVTMRAVLPSGQAVRTLRAMLRPGGRGVLGLAHRPHADPAWRELEGELVEVSVLDPSGWLLIMQRSGD